MIERREFLKIALLAGVMGGGALLPASGKAADQEIGIAVVEGENPKVQVQEAIRLLGGIQRFVRRGDRVVLLPNPQGTGRGVTTNPDMVAETVRLCLAAGASSVSVSSCHGQEDWRGTGIIEKVEGSGGRMKYPESDRDWTTIRISNARVRKEVKVIRDALQADVLINMPIFKQHNYTRVTGCLKNLMGTNDDNWSFHKGDLYLHPSHCRPGFALFPWPLPGRCHDHPEARGPLWPRKSDPSEKGLRRQRHGRTGRPVLRPLGG